MRESHLVLVSCSVGVYYMEGVFCVQVAEECVLSEEREVKWNKAKYIMRSFGSVYPSSNVVGIF